MMETPGALMKIKKSLNLVQDESGKSSTLGTTINTLSGDTIQINDNIYALTLEISETLSLTSYTGKSKKNQNDFFMTNSTKNDINCPVLVIDDRKEKNIFHNNTS